MKSFDSWDKSIREAENILSGKEILPIDVMISIIKRINPTPHISLTPGDKENAYRLKSDLQSLLLTTYGELFDLEPVKWDENIVLLRYRMSPFVDACHAKMHILSESALAQVRKGDVVPATKQKKKPASKRPAAMDISTLQGIIDQARMHIDSFEYDSARTLLSGISINTKDEISIFLKGISILLDELGAFDVAMDRLFVLPEAVINDSIREITANVCWFNSRFTDARGIFEECAIKELKKESIFRYADILHREGESKASLELLNYAESMSGLVEGMNALRQNIYKRLKDEAAPFMESGKKEFDKNDFEAAEEAAKAALAIFPEYDEARELLKIIRDIDSEDIVSSLWKSYHDAKAPMDRLNILKKLQDKDATRKNEISNLIEKAISEEKNKRLEKAVSYIFDDLSAGAYGRAFDKICILLKEDSGSDLLHTLAAKYPQIQDILNNKQLLRLKNDEARECWLSYLRLREISLEEEGKVLPLLKKAGKAFSDEPEYTTIKNRYNAMLADRSRKKVLEYFKVLESANISQEKADEISVLIKNELASLPVEESNGHKQRCQEILHKIKHDFAVNLSRKRYREYCNKMGRPDTSLEEAEHLLAMMSKEAGNMPADEYELSDKGCQRILYELRQLKYIESFRKSLICGDMETVALLKQMIDDSHAVSAIEDDISTLFAVESTPLNLVFNSELHPFAKIDNKAALKFINYIGDEAFFILPIGDKHDLVILNTENNTGLRVCMNNLDCVIVKVIHANCKKKEYHLLCKRIEKYFCVKAVFDRTNSRIAGYIDLSTLVGLDEASCIDHIFILTENRPKLFILFMPDDKHSEVTMSALVDIFDEKLIKKKNFEYQLYCYAMVPTDPPRFVIGGNKIRLYDSIMQRINAFSTYKNFEWCNFISIDSKKELVYAFISAGTDSNTAKLFFLIFDYNLNIISESAGNIPGDAFLAETHYRDSKRDILLIGKDVLFDYTNKKIIKNFLRRKVEFDNSDFILSLGSLDELCDAIKNDEYGIDFLSGENSVGLLNSILCLTDFYDRVLLKKPELKLSFETTELYERVEQYRKKKFGEMTSYEQWEIKSLNRSLMKDVYHMPTIDRLSDHCFFFHQETAVYYICEHNADINQLIVTDISEYIGKIIDSGKQNMG